MWQHDGSSARRRAFRDQRCETWSGIVLVSRLRKGCGKIESYQLEEVGAFAVRADAECQL